MPVLKKVFILSALAATSNLYAQTTPRVVVVPLITEAQTVTVNSGGAFGDGTAGALVISTNTNWGTTFQSNTNFTSCDIQSNQTLTVPSGTVIRCTGNFNNQGTINVLPWTEGSDGVNINSLAGQSANEAGTGNNIALAFSNTRLRGLLYPGFEGGGNGDDGNGSDNTGGAGAGTLVIRASGTLTNSGTIRANGGNAVTDIPTSNQSGGGGGAGGFIILASEGGISISGSIEVRGGNGSAPGTGDDDHAGGGGSGGLVHIISPNASGAFTGNGNVDFSGGFPGSEPANNLGSNGGAGGAMGGNGGRAGVDVSGIFTAASSGEQGQLFLTVESSPGSLFNL